MTTNDTNSSGLSNEALQSCQQLIRHGSHSFFMASWVLPKRLAIPATSLYAFCRVADDLIDADDGGVDAVAHLSKRLDAIYASEPMDFPEDQALMHVVHGCNIPRAMLDALLEGLAWDATDRRYESLSELYDYAARVAGCVGAMMALIMERSDERAIARACDLGVAMQLTNIARDIGEDARMGRLYLPRKWFAEAGMDADAWLVYPRQTPEITAMCKRLLGYADILYKRADAGIALLPLSCRPGIRAARVIYSDIGREIAQQNYATVAKRAIVPKPRKLWLLAKAVSTIPVNATDRYKDTLEWPPLHETRYLLDDIDSVPHQSRIAWLVDLFSSLEQRRRGVV